MNETAQPLRVAIIGSGPSGLYAAGALQRSTDVAAQVDVFDRLPTPWGLVRAGVAPDHPNIKAVTRMYEKTASHPEFRFFGNVEIGRDITVEELCDRYHAVIYAFGAAADRRLGIEGEDLPGSWAATEFVAWYNGHPDYRDLEFDLSGQTAVVVGNGNVAADVARMLALTYDELAVTDVADHALEVLRDSSITEIVVLGRRGPAQAAFTNPEVLELGELEDADVIVDPRDVDLDAASRAWIESDEADMTSRRNVEIFTEYSQRTPEGKRKRVVLRFLTSPVEIVGDGKVEGVVVERNELVQADDGSLKARSTGERETIPASLVFRSVGYRGVALEGVPFDDARAVIPNELGRVLDRGGRRAGPGPVRRRLDQARAERDHRHEQARRAGDRQGAAGGRRGGQDARLHPARARVDRGAAGRALRRPRHVRALGDDRPGRARGRRAARPPAREVLHRRRAARRRRRGRQELNSATSQSRAAAAIRGRSAARLWVPATSTTVRPGAAGGIPNGSLTPWITSTGTSTPSSSPMRDGGGSVAVRRRGGTSGNARHSTPAAPVAPAVRHATRAPEDRPPVTTSTPASGPARRSPSTAVHAASSCFAGAGERRPATR